MFKTKLAEKMNQIKKNKKGFTLIELIVVIAIIGVLAALLVPSMVGYVNKAKDATALSDARTAYTAAQAACTTTNTVPNAVTTYTTASASPLKDAIELLGNTGDKLTSITVDTKGNVTKIIYNGFEYDPINNEATKVTAPSGGGSGL